MDLQTLIAQWSGQVPPGFVPHAVLREEPVLDFSRLPATVRIWLSLVVGVTEADGVTVRA